MTYMVNGRTPCTRLPGRSASSYADIPNVNPVAPALANALHDATGVRYRDLPLTPERIYTRLGEHRLVSAK